MIRFTLAAFAVVGTGFAASHLVLTAGQGDGPLAAPPSVETASLEISAETISRLQETTQVHREAEKELPASVKADLHDVVTDYSFSRTLSDEMLQKESSIDLMRNEDSLCNVLREQTMRQKSVFADDHVTSFSSTAIIGECERRALNPSVAGISFAGGVLR